MNILITGGTGLVGSRLTEVLVEERNHVYILSRSEHSDDHPFIHYIKYEPDDINNLSWAEELPVNMDSVYNLAGASLQKIWTDSHKEEIMDSRINTTRLLYNWVKNSEIKPDVLVNASAVGYYPTSEHVSFTEEDEFQPSNYLASVVTAWEKEALKFEEFGTRVVLGRFGLVLDKDEGVLPMMALPFKFGAGGDIGTGRQFYSWIHLEDLINSLLYVLVVDEMDGPVNMTSPVPLRQEQFAKYLGMALGKPTILKTPGFLFKTVLGDQSILIIRGQKVIPEKLLANEFKFNYPTLDIALDDIYFE